MLCLLFFTAAAQAQTTFSIGPKVGFTASSVRLRDNAHYASSAQYRTGFEAGLISTIGFGHWQLQPALLFSQKGYRFGFNSSTFVGETDKVRLNYITIPLNLAYAQRPDGRGLQVVAGPYLGVLTGGNYEHQFIPIDPLGGASPVISGSVSAAGQSGTTYTAHSQRVDAGLQAGLGYRTGSLLIQATYSLGLRDVGVGPDGYGPFNIVSPSYSNHAIQVSLAYLFSPKS